MELMRAPRTNKNKSGNNIHDRGGFGGPRYARQGGQARKRQYIVYSYIIYLEDFLKKTRNNAGNNPLGKTCD